MQNSYKDVTTRFLSEDERLILSPEIEMPLVIEAQKSTSIEFLNKFLQTNSHNLINDLAKYGAILLRGFDIKNDDNFEQAILSIPEFKGISSAFMSEEGRVHSGAAKFILHTNAVYKTGGTLYLGGFHSENYYSTDVPSYICFCCLQPSEFGGETGLINMEKVYDTINPNLKHKLEQNNFLASTWLLSEVMERYNISEDAIKKICADFDLPIVGIGKSQCILMYKPNIFIHPLTNKKALQINLFEIIQLNKVMRKYFMQDYSGKKWFWHRVVWKIPSFLLKIIEKIYIMFASFFYSPKDSLNILKFKIKLAIAMQKNKKFMLHSSRVGECFNKQDIEELAQLLRQNYSSCLWQKGDILIVDNKKVAHAGMPGGGDRLIRAMICNPLKMTYNYINTGIIDAHECDGDAIGVILENTTQIHETD